MVQQVYTSQNNTYNCSSINISRSLMAGHNTAARGFGFFDIQVDLTKEGFENIDAIITIIFQV